MKKSELIKITVLLYLSVVITVLLVKLSSFELPDLSGINEVVKKANGLTIMAENLTAFFETLLNITETFNTYEVEYYFKEFLNFTGRLDGINGADIIIRTLPYWSAYFVNGSVS